MVPRRPMVRRMIIPRARPIGPCSGGGSVIFLGVALSFRGAPATGDDEEDEEAAQTGGEADDEAFVVFDPGRDFAAEV